MGIETAGLAIPGVPRPLKALCVVPMGMEEGTRVDVPSDELLLTVGQPEQFRMFSSPVRKQDTPGTVLSRWTEEEVVETDSLETTLSAREGDDGNLVPIRFQTHVTELGQLELWCVATRDAGRWKLEFSVRDDAES